MNAGPYVCQVRRMKESHRITYWVSISNAAGKEITPAYYADRWKAAFDVAEWECLLNGGPDPMPCILNFNPTTYPNEDEPCEHTEQTPT